MQKNNAALVSNLSPFFVKRGEAIDVLAIDKSVIAGDGLTGGGLLTADVTLNVGQGDGIDVQPDYITLNLAAAGGLDMTGGPLTIELRTNSSLELDGTGIALAGYPNVTLAPTGSVFFDPSSNQVDPVDNYDINLGQIDKKYLTLHAAELWVETLVAQDTIATIGGRILVGPTTTLIGDMIYGELLLNTGFESGTGTDADNWTEANGSTRISTEGPHSGTWHISTSYEDSSYVSQAVDVSPGNLYHLSFWTKTDPNLVAGLYLVYDETNGADIISLTSTGVSTTTYTQVDDYFVVPADCFSVGIYLYEGVAFGKAYYDDVSLTQVIGMQVKHNQIARSDILYMEANAKVEFMSVDGADITGVDTSSEWFKIAGDYTDVFVASEKFTVVGSTGNDGEWTVSSSAYAAGETQINVTGDVTDATVDGYILYVGDQTGEEFLYLDVTRNLDGSGINDWYAGDAVFNTGTTGDGFIDLYSLNGVLSGAGPTIVGNVRTGTAYNAWDEHWAIGNLNGLYGVGASDVYGVGLGQYATGKPHILIDSTNGIQIKQYTTTVGQWSTAGVITVGETGASRTYITIDSTNGIKINNGATPTVIGQWAVSGALTIGEVAASRSNITIDSTNGIQIRNNTTVLGNWDVSGNLTIGSTAAGKANMQYATATGQLNFRAGTGTVQAYIDTSGRIVAGGGNTSLNASGLELIQDYSLTSTNTIRWVSAFAGTTYATIGAGTQVNGTRYNRVRMAASAAPTKSGAYFEAQSDEASVDQLYMSTRTNIAGALINDGSIYINNSSNTYSTIGLTIQQSTNDDDVITLRSSTDVDHSMTTYASTDTFCTIRKAASADGGTLVTGLTDTILALHLRGMSVSEDTTKSAAGNACVRVSAYTRSGSGPGVTSPSTTANIMSVCSDGSARAIFEANGELHIDADATGTAGNVNIYDEYDDMALLSGLRASLTPEGHYLREQFGDFISYARNVLEPAGVVTYNDGPGEDGRPFIALRALHYLEIDAMRQMYNRMMAYERALMELGMPEERLKELTG